MNPNTPDFHEIVLAHAEEDLFPARKQVSNPQEYRSVYHSFLRRERDRIKDAHNEGSTGLDIAAWRAALIDVIITEHYNTAAKSDGPLPYTLVASGGYGRGLLNPGSDVDLQFILHESVNSRTRNRLEESIRDLLTLLFDGGLTVGHGVRTIREATKFANKDHPTKTAFLDARLIAGDAEKFDEFETAFFNECIKGKEVSYLKERSEVIRARHRKHGRTPHRQEPHVKMGCGGLRDYHNLIWLIWMLEKSRNLYDLVKSKRLTLLAYSEIEEAYEFLMRVRNELHFIQKGNAGDIMTLRHQGIIATHFEYKGGTIIKRSENFMRDYYRHTKALYQHGRSLMQAFHLDVEDSTSNPIPIVGALAARFQRNEVNEFEGFESRGNLIFPGKEDPFAGKPNQMMRFFLHTQQRGLKTSPEIRKLFKDHWYEIDDSFRRSRSNRETFEQILQNRGQVAHILRQMHRVEFLGRYLPEFGQLTDLVQHEFFHQYTADEHTLRCIDELDRILQSDDPKEQVFREIFQDFHDPVALYIALIMHDTGRAENVRIHEDASAILAEKVCKRLNYTGDRLRLIMFLVDHHLSFWRTATTSDISDRATISDFATTVKSKSYMKALYLFTYVDSRGTNDEAWNDWKASLMQQLYRATSAYFNDRKAFEEKFRRPMSQMTQKVMGKLSESYAEEVEAHFKTLPERYFNYRGATSISRHVKLFRRFFNKVRDGGLESLCPEIGWEARPDEGYTLMEAVCWNRHNLLSTIAGALSSLDLNILSADIFMREDDLVLDIFRVCTTNFHPISERDIKRIEKLISDACAIGEKSPDINFKKLIEKQAEPSILDEPSPRISMPQRVFVTNGKNKSATVLEIQAADRIGLLYDIFNVLSQLNTEVLSARISTQAGAAIDRFFLVDTSTEEKIVDQEKLDAIQSRVWECVAVAEKDMIT
ncbi:MAG: [protein-PII] uridylyltransferase [Verrucomicrobiales bacterium]|nr:[protein-PII] uridylyltransferase [Verrucomicrobiales bacterium]